MTYSLNTLNASSSDKSPPRTVPRLGQEAGLALGLLALVLWLLALLSYSPQDAAWSTSGVGAGAVHNWAGRLGAWLADGSYFALGFSVWWGVVAAVYAWLAALARWMRAGEAPRSPAPERPAWWGRMLFWGGLLLLLCASTALEWSRLYRFESALPGHAGGLLGYWLGPVSMQWLGFTGSGLVGIALVVVAVALVFGFSWGHLAEALGARIEALVQSGRARRELARDVAEGKRAAREREEVVFEERQEIEVQHPQPVQIIEPVLVEVPQSTRVAKERQKPLFSEMPDSRLPQVDLLDGAAQHMEVVSAETLGMTSRLIEKKLKDFGVDVTVVAAMPGPVITRYEIEPATGVKGSQVVNLAKDLARSLSLVSIRVVETIPGKTTMALELPNAKRQTIKLSEILGSQVYNEAKSLLTMGLGKDIVGNPVVADLAKMPHVLVAGTTGSGKSVGINAMILSLLYKAEAKDVRLLMIDPKMLEMSVYEGIPHLLAPVVTDMRQAAHGLNWCVAEMERRYRLMTQLGVRNLTGFNQKIREAAAAGQPIADPLWQPNPTGRLFDEDPEQPPALQPLPYIVVVIDEFADMIMIVGKKVEQLIARIAQKARAAGIHLILATQRPSVDVITGLIKANIPTRIAFQVSSKIDSRTIIDQSGAEQLLGHGDMLYLPAGTSLPMRVHGAFVADDEVHRVVEEWRRRGTPDYLDEIINGIAGGEGDGGGEGEREESAEQDPLYDQAVAFVTRSRKASISAVQRQLRIGYNRAARMIEAMEEAGVVSRADVNQNRKVLAPPPAGE